MLRDRIAIARMIGFPMTLEQLTSLMVDAIVQHVEGASRIDERTIALPFRELRAEVLVHRVSPRGMAQLHVWLTGGPLGARAIEDNFVGFAETPERAVVSGAHDWVHGSFVAARAAFGGGEPSTRLTHDGTTFDVFVSPRAYRGPRGETLAHSFEDALVERIHSELPVLHRSGPSFVSAFVAHAGPDSITVEVKIDGSDWPAAGAVFDSFAWPEGDDYASVRELAILVPRTARTTLSSPQVLRRTLAGLARSEGAPGAFGSEVHGFVPGAPLEGAPEGLPDDFARFVTQVAASGVGPGYGLLSPAHPAQMPLRVGTFDGSRPRGVVALAHHGCNAMALLVCGGPHHGEVWVDARSNESAMTKIAGSFGEYYERWLLGTARREAPTRLIDPARCALSSALSSYLKARDESHPGEDARASIAAIGDAAIATVAGGDEYFDRRDSLDLCTGCWDIGRRLGLQRAQVVPGVAPKQGR